MQALPWGIQRFWRQPASVGVLGSEAGMGRGYGRSHGPSGFDGSPQALLHQPWVRNSRSDADGPRPRCRITDHANAEIAASNRRVNCKLSSRKIRLNDFVLWMLWEGGADPWVGPVHSLKWPDPLPAAIDWHVCFAEGSSKPSNFWPHGLYNDCKSSSPLSFACSA